jgi:hypothetical protein
MASETRSAEKTLRKKRYGRCRICQKFGRLTKEHVPPKNAFNDRSYLEYYVNKSNEAERVKWEMRDVESNGIYLFTLCEKCNNHTGRLYGTDYGKFVQAFTSVATPEHAGSVVQADVNSFFPLRVIKQAISMMLSTSEATSFNGYERFASPFLAADTAIPPGFTVRPADVIRLRGIYDELRKFVLDKQIIGLPQGVRLGAYAVANEGAALRTGIGLKARLSINTAHWVVVVGLWPIHWVLLLQGDPLVEEEVADFTDWAGLSFKTKKNQTVRMPCQWSAGKYPLDFRSPKDLQRDHFINTMRLEGFCPSVVAHNEEMFKSALNFARTLGKRTKEGYLISQFKSGTYCEIKGQFGWFEGIERDQALAFVKSQVNPNLAALMITN